MADDGDSMASSLLESLGEQELLRILAEGFSRESLMRGDRQGSDPKLAQRALVACVVRTILDRSFPTLANRADMDAVESDVTDALLAHEQSLRRIERLAATLRSQGPSPGGLE